LGFSAESDFSAWWSLHSCSMCTRISSTATALERAARRLSTSAHTPRPWTRRPPPLTHASARKPTHAHARTHARTHARKRARTHSLCPNRCGTAGVQLAKIESAGTAAETALLADMKAKNPGASSIELLRLVKVCCRRWICCPICTALCCVRAACCMCCICCASNRDHSRQPFAPGQTAQLHAAFPMLTRSSLASLRASARSSDPSANSL
jgi:hypothetical protein